MMQLILERLENNDLLLPKHATSGSAGIDFSACLTRPQRWVPQGAKFNDTVPFVSLEDGSRKWLKDGDSFSASAKQVILNPRETIMISLGYKCQFQQNSWTPAFTGFVDNVLSWPQPTANHVLMLYVRSSVGMMGLELANGTGIIDEDYRGELWAIMHNRNMDKPVKITHGDKIVQGIIVKYDCVHVVEGTLCSTHRGSGGFGSTDSLESKR
jgi:dUTPase